MPLGNVIYFIVEFLYAFIDVCVLSVGGATFGGRKCKMHSLRFDGLCGHDVYCGTELFWLGSSYYVYNVYEDCIAASAMLFGLYGRACACTEVLFGNSKHARVQYVCGWCLSVAMCVCVYVL